MLSGVVFVGNQEYHSGNKSKPSPFGNLLKKEFNGVW